MSMINWAENEVRIACQREAPDRKEGEWDYGCACYESALKAYQSLCSDDHSGFSFSMTRNILERLMNSLPLTPIDDTPDVWNDVTISELKKESYQCRRMSSLFKDIYPDGRVEYHDTNLCYTVYESNPDIAWHNGTVSNVIHEMWPIKMPYYPSKDRIKVVCDERLFDPKNGSYDTIIIKYAVRNGKRVDINRYFHEEGDGMVEITEERFKELEEEYEHSV